MYPRPRKRDFKFSIGNTGSLIYFEMPKKGGCCYDKRDKPKGLFKGYGSYRSFIYGGR
jgi:hypothetical protein